VEIAGDVFKAVSFVSARFECSSIGIVQGVNYDGVDSACIGAELIEKVAVVQCFWCVYLRGCLQHGVLRQWDIKTARINFGIGDVGSSLPHCLVDVAKACASDRALTSDDITVRFEGEFERFIAFHAQ